MAVSASAAFKHRDTKLTCDNDKPDLTHPDGSQDTSSYSLPEDEC